MHILEEDQGFINNILKVYTSGLSDPAKDGSVPSTGPAMLDKVMQCVKQRSSYSYRVLLDTQKAWHGGNACGRARPT